MKLSDRMREAGVELWADQVGALEYALDCNRSRADNNYAKYEEVVKENIKLRGEINRLKERLDDMQSSRAYLQDELRTMHERYDTGWY